MDEKRGSFGKAAYTTGSVQGSFESRHIARLLTAQIDAGRVHADVIIAFARLHAAANQAIPAVVRGEIRRRGQQPFPFRSSMQVAGWVSRTISRGTQHSD